MDDGPTTTALAEPRPHEAELGEDQLRRLLDIGALVAGAIWIGFASLAFWDGRQQNATLMAAFGIAAGASAVTGRCMGSRAGGTHLAAVLLGGIGTVSASRGGVDPVVVQWYAIAPLAAVLGGRPRNAIWWGGIGIASIGVLALVQHLGWLPAAAAPSRYGAALSSVAMLATVLLIGTLLTRHRVAAAARETELQRSLFESQKLDGLGRLAGAIAHDFNNVLSVIVLRGELAASSMPAQDERSEDLEAIVLAARHGQQLTRDLLGFAKSADDGSSESLHPGEVVREVARLLERVLPKNIRMTVDLADGVPYVRTSHHRLHQILMNLSLNAKEAMPEGGSLQLVTSAFVGRPPGAGRSRSRRFARISVIDDGMGMSDRVRQRILDPFFTTKPQGTGLGLAIVQRVVADCGGVIDISSAPARGSRFDVYLPAVLEPEDVSTGG